MKKLELSKGEGNFLRSFNSDVAISQLCLGLEPQPTPSFMNCSDTDAVAILIPVPKVDLSLSLSPPHPSYPPGLSTLVRSTCFSPIGGKVRRRRISCFRVWEKVEGTGASPDCLQRPLVRCVKGWPKAKLLAACPPVGGEKLLRFSVQSLRRRMKAGEANC